MFIENGSKTDIILSMNHRFSRLLCIIVGLLFLLSAPSADALDDEAELFLVAQKAFDDGFYDVAIRYLNRYLETYPHARRTQARLLLGQCLFFKAQYLDAFHIFQEQLDDQEFGDVALFWLGETYFKTKDYTKAAEQYRLIVKNHPDSYYAPQAMYSLGWTHFEQEKFEASKQDFRDFLQLYPAHALAEDAVFKLGECDYNLNNYKKAVDAFREYVQRYPDSLRHDRAYFYLGESHYYLEEFEKAEDYYRKTLTLSHDDKLRLITQVCLGWCYYKLSDYGQALERFSEAQKSAEEKGLPSDDILLGKANVLYEQEIYDDSLTAYDTLLKDFPESPRRAEALLGKANLLYAMEDFEKAIQHYRAILEQWAGQDSHREIVEKAHFGLAWTQLKRGRVDEAIGHFEKIIENSPSKMVKISAFTQIGDAYQDVGEYDQALAVYDKILKDFPDSLYTDYIQYRQGVALLKMNKIDAATLSFNSLKKNFPQSRYLPDIKYYLGLAYFKKNEWTAARQQLEKFIAEISPANEFKADALYILASSHFNLRDYDRALHLFRDIAKKYPHRTKLARDSEISIAKCLYGLGHVKEALKKFKIIAYKYPGTGSEMEVLLWISDYYTKILDYDNAILYYEQILDHFPQTDKKALVRYKLGLIYQDKASYDEALNQFKMITPDMNKEVAVKAELAIAEIFSKQWDPETAIETYENIARNSPDFKRDAFIKMAELLSKQNEFAQAVDMYRKAIRESQINSEIPDAELQFRIADMYENMHKQNAAVEAYLKIPYLYQENKPWVVKAYLRLARIFEDEEDWENARLVYNKIIDYGTDEVKFAQERIEWIKENVDKSQVY